MPAAPVADVRVAKDRGYYEDIFEILQLFGFGFGHGEHNHGHHGHHKNWTTTTSSATNETTTTIPSKKNQKFLGK